MISPQYRAQVDLLLTVLPHASREECFALKGGTAINLFVRDMSRISVDIDLAYLPFDDRATALRNIGDALGRIKQGLEKGMSGIAVRAQPQTAGGQDAKLICTLHRATVKIEVNTVMRGHLWPARVMELAPSVQEEFHKFAAIQVVSHAELFGGKICAALDRQHPRDLFDIHLLLAHEGVSDEMRLGFIASLLGHARPIHELLRPNFQDQRAVFETQFAGMTRHSFTYEEFDAAREALVRELHARFTDSDRAFLLSFKSGDPDWALFPDEALEAMPAVQWKLVNIQKLKQENPAKHAAQLRALEKRLEAPT